MYASEVFHVGDRVIITGIEPGFDHTVGLKGTVKSVDDYSVGVEHDEYIGWHVLLDDEGNGHAADGYGLWYGMPLAQLSIIDEEQKQIGCDCIEQFFV